MAWNSNWSRSYAFNFYQKAAMLLYFCLLAPLWAPFAAWWFLAAKDSETAMGLTGIAAIVCAGASWFYSRVTAHYMVVEEMSFRRAAAHTFYPVLAWLAHLPVAGALFRRFFTAHEDSEDVSPAHAVDASIPGEAKKSSLAEVEKERKISSKRVER